MYLLIFASDYDNSNSLPIFDCRNARADEAKNNIYCELN